jgi:hypothetical protein
LTVDKEQLTTAASTDLNPPQLNPLRVMHVARYLKKAPSLEKPSKGLPSKRYTLIIKKVPLNAVLFV